MKRFGWMALIALAAIAQERRVEMRVAGPGEGKAADVMIWRAGPGGMDFEMGTGPHSVQFIVPDGMPGGAVKGAPYSGEHQTEFVQTLADGTRISRRNSASVWRDSEGRIRREVSMDGADGARKMIFIEDPVAKVHYILNPQERTARKLMVPMFAAGNVRVMARSGGATGVAGAAVPATPGGPGVQVHTFERKIEIADGKVRTDQIIGADDGPGIGFPPMAAMKMEVAPAEDLGMRNIEGINARGTRTRMTLPAGAIGNDRPITSVTETWYSDELKTIVLRESKDARFGDTTTRLTNIRRSEPSKDLFEIPADYKVEDIAPKIRTLERKREEIE